MKKLRILALALGTLAVAGSAPATPTQYQFDHLPWPDPGKFGSLEKQMKRKALA